MFVEKKDNQEQIKIEYYLKGPYNRLIERFQKITLSMENAIAS